MGQLKILKGNFFTECWYDQYVGVLFPIIKFENGYPGHYTVDISALPDKKEGEFAFVPACDGEVVRNVDMYIPTPIDTSAVVLPEEIEALTEKIAASTHDTWVKGKLESGITDHEDLIPYDELTEDKKDVDRKTAMQALKIIYTLGYEIKKIEDA